MSSTAQPFLWSQRCRDLPRFRIYRSGSCVCFSDAPPNTKILAVFEGESPGGYVAPVSGNCLCPTIDMAQFIQHGKWIHLIAVDPLDVNTIYACTDYIDNFYASMDLSIKADTRLDIVTQLAPKNVYAVLEVALSAPLPFPSLPLLTLRDMCWMSTPAGSLPYVCRCGYYMQASLWIDKYCEENQVRPPPWTSIWNAWYTFIDMDIDYQQNRAVLRRVLDETALFNLIDTGCHCVDDVGRQLPIRLTWVDFYRFVVGLYTEVTLYTVAADTSLVCANIVGGRCLPTPTGFELNIGNPFKEKESEFTAARQLIALQLQSLGVLGVSHELVSKTASTASTAILSALSMFPFYTPEAPAEGVKPASEAPITFFAQAVVSSIEGAISKAIRIVIKSVARTYMVLKTYFELGLSVPTSALIYFLNHFIKLITDIACRIASKCIGFVGIVLTIPYAVKRLREVAEQEYDIKKPLTSLHRMFTGFGKAARDIFTAWLASVFAGAILCSFVKCPKLEPIRPPLIHLPDWYVFEDFCADLCRTPLIEGRIRDYITCVSRCVASTTPRKPPETVAIILRDRAVVYINEFLPLVDVHAGPYPPGGVPVKPESIHMLDTATTTARKRETVSASEPISLSEAYSCTTVARVIQSPSESIPLSEAMNTLVAQRIIVNVGEGSGISEAVSTQVPSVTKINVSEGFSSTDKMPGWVPFPSVAPYARWIEAVNEYISMPYGTSVVITDILTGEVIRIGVTSRTFFSIDMVKDSTSIEAMPAVFILPSDSAQGLLADAVQVTAKPPIRIQLSDSTKDILADLLSVGLVRPVKLSTPVAPLVGITIPAVPPHLRMLAMSLVKRTSLSILIPHSTRTKTAVKLTSPIRLTTYTLIPQAMRQKTGTQLASPVKTCAQVTITV